MLMDQNATGHTEWYVASQKNKKQKKKPAMRDEIRPRLDLAQGEVLGAGAERKRGVKLCLHTGAFSSLFRKLQMFLLGQLLPSIYACFPQKRCCWCSRPPFCPSSSTETR